MRRCADAADLLMLLMLSRIRRISKISKISNISQRCYLHLRCRFFATFPKCFEWSDHMETHWNLFQGSSCSLLLQNMWSTGGSRYFYLLKLSQPNTSKSWKYFGFQIHPLRSKFWKYFWEIFWISDTSIKIQILEIFLRNIFQIHPACHQCAHPLHRSLHLVRILYIFYIFYIYSIYFLYIYSIYYLYIYSEYLVSIFSLRKPGWVVKTQANCIVKMNIVKPSKIWGKL